MTTGMTTQKLEGQISLPRAGLGALLAATLLTGGLIGAAVSAGIGAAISQPATVGMTLPRESTVVRDLRIKAGRGQLIGDAIAQPAAVKVTLPRESTVVRDLRMKAGNGPLVGDAPGRPATMVNQTESDTHKAITGHAPGHGPLE